MNFYKALVKTLILKLMRRIEVRCQYFLVRDNEYYPLINPMVGIRAPQPCELDPEEVWTYGLDKIQVALSQFISREVYHRKIEGAIAELGVFRGYNACVMNYFFPDRKLFLFDTFEGLDPRDLKEDAQLGYNTNDYRRDWGNTNIEMVMSKMYHRDNVVLRKGWFPESAIGLEDETFCFVFLDAVLYRPMYEGLRWFYPRLANGGYIVVDVFNWDRYPGVKKAVCDFSKEVGINYIPIPNRTGSVVIGKPLF